MDYSEDLLHALTEIVNDSKWQKVGFAKELSKQSCTKFYVDAEDDEMVVQPDDIALFCVGTKDFYAIDCSCPHEGGPLDLGDIEDINGSPCVICPWHSYDFNLKNGSSMTGLQTNTYEVKVVNDEVFINCEHKLNRTVAHSTEVSNQTETIHDQANNEFVNDLSLSAFAKTILNTADPAKKVELTRETVKSLREGIIQDIGFAVMPEQPQRKKTLEIKEPGKIKRGRGGTLQSRIALLHSLANIEQWAIDLSWDIIGRFSQVKVNGNQLPFEFFKDFAKVADDEAKPSRSTNLLAEIGYYICTEAWKLESPHFSLINERLLELDSHFGALPVHNGLWQSAEETAHDLLARIAIVHMVHEARGLDVHPKTSQRFASQNDKTSVELMELIYNDEITHVACGMKWFTYVCRNSQPPLDPVSTFHKLVRKHFKGFLKPPFNTTGRSIAGMNEEWYAPLVKPK